MLPIDCHAYGADFIARAGHKWLCGGPGTGILYVRTSGADLYPLPPFAMGNFLLYGNPFVDPSPWYESRAWNRYDEVDYVFGRLVDRIARSGLTQST